MGGGGSTCLCSSLADRSAVCDLLLCVRLQLTVWLWGGGWICMFTPTYAPPSLTEALFVIYCCVSGCSWLFDYGGGVDLHVYPHLCSSLADRSAVCDLLLCVRLQLTVWLWGGGGSACLPPPMLLPCWPKRCLWFTVVCPVAADCLTMGGG